MKKLFYLLIAMLLVPTVALADDDIQVKVNGVDIIEAIKNEDPNWSNITYEQDPILHDYIVKFDSPDTTKEGMAQDFYLDDGQNIEIINNTNYSVTLAFNDNFVFTGGIKAEGSVILMTDDLSSSIMFKCTDLDTCIDVDGTLIIESINAVFGTEDTTSSVGIKAKSSEITGSLNFYNFEKGIYITSTDNSLLSIGNSTIKMINSKDFTNDTVAIYSDNSFSLSESSLTVTGYDTGIKASIFRDNNTNSLNISTNEKAFDIDSYYLDNEENTIETGTNYERTAKCSSYKYPTSASRYIYFDYNDDSGKIDKYVVSSEEGVVSQENEEIPTPTKDGYTFEGWYYDEALTSKVETTAPISYIAFTYSYNDDDCSVSYNDVIVYAKWTKVAASDNKAAASKKIKTEKENPDTGAYIGIGATLIFIGSGIGYLLYSHKKKTFLR